MNKNINSIFFITTIYSQKKMFYMYINYFPPLISSSKATNKQIDLLWFQFLRRKASLFTLFLYKTNTLNAFIINFRFSFSRKMMPVFQQMIQKRIITHVFFSSQMFFYFESPQQTSMFLLTVQHHHCSFFFLNASNLTRNWRIPSGTRVDSVVNSCLGLLVTPYFDLHCLLHIPCPRKHMIYISMLVHKEEHISKSVIHL